MQRTNNLRYKQLIGPLKAVQCSWIYNSNVVRIYYQNF